MRISKLHSIVHLDANVNPNDDCDSNASDLIDNNKR